jgi:hypothetical protein
MREGSPYVLRDRKIVQKWRLKTATGEYTPSRSEQVSDYEN